VAAWWKFINRNKTRKLVYEQLQQQRIMLQQGVPAHARIIEIESQYELLKGYIALRVWVMIRLQERLLYQQVHTMVPTAKLPAVGEVVSIRILPENTAAILIL
jgi:hypothetical protein